MRIIEKSMHIWPMNMEPTVFCTTNFQRKFEGFRAGKVRYEDGHHLGQFWSGMIRLLFLKETFWRQPPWNCLWTMWKMWCCVMAHLKQLFVMILTWEKLWQDGYSIPNKPAKDTESSVFKGLAQNVWTSKLCCDVITRDGTWLYFYGIPSKWSSQM